MTLDGGPGAARITIAVRAGSPPPANAVLEKMDHRDTVNEGVARV